uniref:BED-type domain-containing protein n=1 Tax=Strongyloides papillosus TaxID=174720 RepID=A0A0N5BH13_STREA
MLGVKKRIFDFLSFSEASNFVEIKDNNEIVLKDNDDIVVSEGDNTIVVKGDDNDNKKCNPNVFEGNNDKKYNLIVLKGDDNDKKYDLKSKYEKYGKMTDKYFHCESCGCQISRKETSAIRNHIKRRHES